MIYQNLKVSVKDFVAVMILSNPPVNALSANVLMELKNAFESMKDDANVRAIVLTGEGAVFAAGADIKELQNLKSAKEAEELSKKAEVILEVIENFSKPVICAINGFCLGGGNELAMACHIRIAGDRARIGQPEINLGIMPGMGGTQRLPRLISKSKAFEMLLTGDPISAQEAKAIGLVNAVVPESMLMNHATGIAKKIAQKSLSAVRLIIEAVNKGTQMKLDESLDFESELFGKANADEDAKEGLSAFLEKRQPKFRDK